MKTQVSLACLLLPLAFSSVARADDDVPRAQAAGRPVAEPSESSGASVPSASSAAEPAQERNWYGTQTIVADVVSVVAMPALGLATRQALVPATIGLAGFTFATPIIHLAHANYGWAALSFTARAGVLAGAFGVAVQSFNCHSCSQTASMAMLGLAAIAVPVIDAAVFAYEPGTKPEAKRGASVFPTVATDGRGASAGLSGSF